MASSWTDILESKVFTFVVGERQKEFTVHASALAKVSKPLDVLLNGQMKEAREGRVEWPDVDEQTFACFIQWVYSKIYDVPAPNTDLVQATTRSSSHNPTIDTAPPRAETHGLKMPATSAPVTVSKCPKCNAVATERCSRECPSCKNTYIAHRCAPCKETFPDECANCRSGGNNCPVCGTRAQWKFNVRCGRCPEHFWSFGCWCSLKTVVYFPITCVDCFIQAPAVTDKSEKGATIRKFIEIGRTTTTFIPRSNTSFTEDYTNIFLRHAHLYTIGDKYLIAELKQLAFDRLHATLKAFTFYPSRPQSIIALTKYIFENTQSKDEMRKMITLYFAFIIEDLSKTEGVQELLEELPELAVALVMQTGGLSA